MTEISRSASWKGIAHLRKGSGSAGPRVLVGWLDPAVGVPAAQIVEILRVVGPVPSLLPGAVLARNAVDGGDAGAPAFGSVDEHLRQRLPSLDGEATGPVQEKDERKLGRA